MIASVRGEVLVRRPDHVVVEAAGVGYRLEISAQTLRSVPACGNEVTLHAHLVTREDAMTLFGFAAEAERDLFLKLLTVSGVGPRVSLAICSGAPAREMIRLIAAGDTKAVQAAPGVGKKTAQRIIVELKEAFGGDLPAGDGLAGGESDPRSEAREGLLGLGYEPAEVEALLRDVEGAAPEELIAAALKRAAGRARG
ncbi:MAG: Holliday junction branch migration protein RuvA [Solirubrobacterales bacterium]